MYAITGPEDFQETRDVDIATGKKLGPTGFHHRRTTAVRPFMQKKETNTHLSEKDNCYYELLIGEKEANVLTTCTQNRILKGAPITLLMVWTNVLMREKYAAISMKSECYL